MHQRSEIVVHVFGVVWVLLLLLSTVVGRGRSSWWFCYYVGAGGMNKGGRIKRGKREEVSARRSDVN